MHQDLGERLRHGYALSGLGWVGDAIPRALPWAFTGCPFGAGEITRSDLSHLMKAVLQAMSSLIHQFQCCLAHQ